MNKMMKLYWKVFAEPFIRRPFIKRIRERYNSANMPSIICSNCIGGEIYHDLGMKFYSPTINLWMSESDFLKLINDLNTYLSDQLVFQENGGGYPIAKLRDITIHFLHYKTENDAAEKWYSRCKRVDYNNIYVIMCDLELTEKEFLEFQNLTSAKKKIMFTTNPDRAKYKDVFFIKEYAANSYVRKYAVNRLNGYRDFERFWDFIGWLNDRK